MVKIQSRMIRKKYKRGSQLYAYRQLLLPFPARCNRVLEPFLKKKLHFEMDVEEGSLSIRLTEQSCNNYENG